MKIRHYGLMASSNATTKLEVARALLEDEGARGLETPESGGDWFDLYERLTGDDLRKCPRCGGNMGRHDLRSFEGRAALARAGKGPEP